MNWMEVRPLKNLTLCTSNTPTSYLRILQGNQPTATTTDDMLGELSSPSGWERGRGRAEPRRRPRSSITGHATTQTEVFDLGIRGTVSTPLRALRTATCITGVAEEYAGDRSSRGRAREEEEKKKGKDPRFPYYPAPQILAADSQSNGSQTIQGVSSHDSAARRVLCPWELVVM